MLIGAHVSPAGGLPKAVERGLERGCRAIQIFNQSPRMWRPTVYRDEDVAAFREALAESPIDAVLIHAVYLLNCASDDPDIRAKSLASLTHSLRVGQQIGAAGVVLHPGSAKTGHVGEAIARAGATIAEALAESEGCELHLENTAGAGGTLGRSFEELAAAARGRRGGRRRAARVCLDSCHLLASGYDIRTAQGMAAVLREASRKLGRGRIRSLHLNDSQTPLGSNRDRHANIGRGELGEQGCTAFLSAPGAAEAAVHPRDPRREPRRRLARRKSSSRWRCASAACRPRAERRSRSAAVAPHADREAGRGEHLLELRAQRRGRRDAVGLAEAQVPQARCVVSISSTTSAGPGKLPITCLSSSITLAGRRVASIRRRTGWVCATAARAVDGLRARRAALLARRLEELG